MWKRIGLVSFKHRCKLVHLGSYNSGTLNKTVHCSRAVSGWSSFQNNIVTNDKHFVSQPRMYSVDAKQSLIQNTDINALAGNNLVSKGDLHEIGSSSDTIISLISPLDNDNDTTTSNNSNIGESVTGSDTNAATEIVANSDIVDGSQIVIKSFDELTWWPQDLMIMFLDKVQLTTGLAWWETIAFTTIFVRLCIFPIAVEGMKRGAKLQLAAPEVVPIQMKLERIKKSGMSKEAQQQATLETATEMKAIYKKHGASALGPIVPVLCQMPIFMSFFFALRKLHEYIPELQTGGFGPYDIGPIHFDVTDMTQVDTSYILPIALTASFLAVIEVGGEMADKEMQAKSKNVMRFMALVMFGASTTFPACVTWYWTCNNAYSFCQSSAIQSDSIRQLIGLPQMSEIKAASERAMKAKKTGVVDVAKAPPMMNTFNQPLPTAQKNTINENEDTVDDKGNPIFVAKEEIIEEETKITPNLRTKRKRRRNRRS